MDIELRLSTQHNLKPDMKDVGFGTVFTDHMFVLNYTEGIGWHDARIVPYAPFELDPSTAMIHYGQGIFEGLKAYRTIDGTVQLFRPDENATRLNASAKRLRIPQIDEADFLEAVTTFVGVEKDWVPSEPGTSLYIRPFIFATDSALGLHASRTYIFCIIACPVGNYYKEGINPVSIYVESRDVRAVRGGTGEAKTAGNYAASLRAGEEAIERGFTQVLWLDGVERKYVEEVGSMNVFFKISGEVITPALHGSVLSGITRKSCIELMKSWDQIVTERRITIDEIIKASEDGTLEEAFGTGTAAVVSPIGSITYEGKTYDINKKQIGPTTQKLYDQLTGIQWGKIKDSFGWTITLK